MALERKRSHFLNSGITVAKSEPHSVTPIFRAVALVPELRQALLLRQKFALRYRQRRNAQRLVF